MAGFRFRFNVPDDQPGDPKILQHRILLPVGLVMLALGLWSTWRFFHIHPPADDALHPVPLQEVLTVTDVPNPFATNEIQAVELHTKDNRTIRYVVFAPCFDRVSHRDTNLTLLVDSTNRVWLVKDVTGHEFGRAYFRRLHLEAKSVSAVAALLFVPLGGMMFFCALALECALRRQRALPGGGGPVSARKFSLFAGLIGYLYIFGFFISPLLSRILPRMIVALIWVVTAGLLARLILWYFRPKPGKPADPGEHLPAEQAGNDSKESL